MKLFRPPGTGDPLRTRPDDAIVEIEVMATFLQHETAGIMPVAAPIAHEESTVVGLDVLGGFNRNDMTQFFRGLGGNKVPVRLGE